MIAALVLWLAFPVAVGPMLHRRGFSLHWLAATLCLLDAAVLAVCGLMCLALPSPPGAGEPATGDTYVWLNPGHEVIVHALRLLWSAGALALVGRARFLKPGRIALWLFGLIHIAVGLAALPRLLWRSGLIDATGSALAVEMGGSQLNVMVLPIAALALAVTALSFLLRRRA